MKINYKAILTKSNDVNFYKNVAKEIVIDDKEITRLINIILEDRDEMSFYPSWLFCHVFDLRKSVIKPHINDLVKFVQKTRQKGSVRSILRCIAGSSTDFINKNLDDEFFNFCFNHFENDKSDLAIRVHAAEIIFNYCTKYPDLKNDFKLSLELQINHYELVNSFSNRINKLLKRLNQ